MKPYISVIIPVYNEEKGIINTVKSVLNQTYEDFEIIIVNDGSKDKTQEYLENIKKEDTRVIVVEQKNSGVSAARNKGLSLACGTIVTFIDAGDIYEKTFLETMICSMNDEDVDLVSCGMIWNEKNISWKYRKKLIGDELYNQCVYLSHNSMLFGSCCNKIFKLEIIRNHDIKFPIQKAMGEDFVFVLSYLFWAQSGLFLQENLYHYIMNNTSVTRTKCKIEWLNDNTVSQLWIQYGKQHNINIAIINEKIIRNQVYACIRVASDYPYRILIKVCKDMVNNEIVQSALSPIQGKFLYKIFFAKLIKAKMSNEIALVCKVGGIIRRIKRFMDRH